MKINTKCDFYTSRVRKRVCPFICITLYLSNQLIAYWICQMIVTLKNSYVSPQLLRQAIYFTRTVSRKFVTGKMDNIQQNSVKTYQPGRQKKYVLTEVRLSRVRIKRVRINRIIYNGSDRRKNRSLENGTYYPRVRLKPSTY